MAFSKDAWLAPAAGDLEEKILEDVPGKGDQVRVRALSGSAANAATSEAIATSQERGRQVMKVDNVMLDVLRFQAGVIEPKFTVDEVKVISAKFGRAFNRVVSEVVALSGIDVEAVNETDARFQGSGSDEAGANGSDAADRPARPPVPARTGAGTGPDGK